MTSSSPATEHLAAVDTARQQSDHKAAAAAAQSAVEADPRSVDAHLARIQWAPLADVTTPNGSLAELDAEQLRTMKAAQAAILAEYEAAAAREPDDALWTYVLSKAVGKDVEAQQRHLARTLEIDGDHLAALQDMAKVCLLGGDLIGRLGYLRRALELAPDNVDLRFAVANAAPRSELKQALVDFVEQFPDDERVAYALHEAAEAAEDDAERVALWERAVAADSGNSGLWSWPGTCRRKLVRRFAYDDPDRAIALIPQVPALLAAIQAARDARSAIQAGDYQAALTQLKAVDLTDRGVTMSLDVDPLVALEVEALRGVGREDAALDLLVDKIAAAPSETLWSVVPAGVRSDIQARVLQRRLAGARPADDFQATDITGRTFRLSDLRGKIVLLNFWYPGCGPCHRELKHLMPRLRAFDASDVELVAVNGVDAEAPLVAGFLQGNGYQATAVAEGGSIATAYGVQGFPTMYIIDRQGRIVAKPHVYDTPTADSFARLLREWVAAPA